MIDYEFIKACATGDIKYVKQHYKRWDLALWNGNIGYGLYHACKENRTEIISLLLDYSKSLKNQERDIYGHKIKQQYTEVISLALEGACVGNQVDVAKLLLDLGVLDIYGIFQCALIAKKGNKYDIIKLLEERGLYQVYNF